MQSNQGCLPLFTLPISHKLHQPLSLLILLPLRVNTLSWEKREPWHSENGFEATLMERLIKQTRRRFSGGGTQDNRDEGSTSADRKIPSQKSQSFREKRRSQSWIRRQFSRQLSWDNDFSGADYPTAVAAAAYAIQSLEESEAEDKKATTSGPDKSLSKKKSRINDTNVPPEPRKSALKPSDTFKDPDKTMKASTSKKMPEKVPSAKKIAFADTDETPRNKTAKSLEKAPSSMIRPSNIADKQLSIGDDNKTETSLPKPETSLSKPDRPPERRPTIQSAEPRKQSAATKPGPGDSQADAWEKEELASIKERYEKLRETIDNWETKKKKKAKRKIERIEAELDKRRVKALQRYRNDMSRVEGIAGGARTQAEENRKNEEFKAKEKANRIRSTGKLPPACLCF